MRGLALDMDGTLLDSMPFHAAAWVRAFEQAGLSAPIEWFYLWEGVNGTEVIERTLNVLGVEQSSEERARIFRSKQQIFDETFRPLPSPGLDVLRATLERLAYPVAVVTGSEASVAEHALAAIGFRSAVALVLGGDQVARGKPAPDPYLEAAKLLSLTDCLVLENAPLGIESAHAAGMPCAAVTTTLSAEHLHAADVILSGLDAFAQWLRDEQRRSGGEGKWLIG